MLLSVRGSGSHPQNQRVEGKLCQAPYWSHWRSLSVPVPDAESQSLAERQSAGRAMGCRKSGVIQWGGSAGGPMILEPWSVIPPGEEILHFLKSEGEWSCLLGDKTVGGREIHAVKGRGNLPVQWHLTFPESAQALGRSPPCTTFWYSHRGCLPPHLAPLNPPFGVWSLLEEQEIQEACQPPTPLDMGQPPMPAGVQTWQSAPTFILPIQCKTYEES